MEAMLTLLKEKGESGVSLSVQRTNGAVRMYQRLGFQIIDENKERISYDERVKQEVLISKKFKPLMIPVLCLMLVDQIIKMVIHLAYMEEQFYILKNLVKFSPQLNTKLSWAGNYIEIFANPVVTILLNLILLFVFFYRDIYYINRRESRQGFSIKVIMICGIAGCLCSLIDKLFWGGSLDYLQIKDLFCF